MWKSLPGLIKCSIKTYLKLKEIYDNFGYRKLSDFNSILIESAHLNPNLIKELKFPDD